MDSRTAEIISLRQYMFGLAYRRVRNAEAAEDIVQNAMLKALEALPRFRGDCGVKGWLRKIVSNETINYGISAVRRGKRETEASEEPVNPVEEAYTYEKDLLRKEIARLPDKQRKVMELKIYEDLSFQEIAEKLSANYETVKANYRHGRVAVEGRMRFKNRRK